MNRGACRALLFLFMVNSSFAVSEEKLFDVQSLLDEALGLHTNSNLHDPLGAIELLNSHRTQVFSLADKETIARYYALKARIYQDIEDDEKVIESALEGLKYAEKDENIIRLQIELAVGYRVKNEFLTGETILLRENERAKALGLNDLYILGATELARSKVERGDYPSANKLLIETYQLAQDLNRDDLRVYVEFVLAILHSNLRNYELTMLYFRNVVENYESKKDWHKLSFALYLLGIIHRNQQKFKLGKNYFQQSFEVAKRIKHKLPEYYARYGMAMNDYRADRCGPAVEGANYAISLKVSRLDWDFELYKLLASCFVRVGKITLAEKYLQSAVDILADIPDLENTIWSVELLKIQAEIDAQKGLAISTYDLMNEYQQKHLEIIQGWEKDKINILQVEFQTEQAKTRNAILEKENELKALDLTRERDEKKMQQYFIGAIIVAVLGLIYILYLQIKLKNEFVSKSLRDPLTQLLNRRYLFEYLQPKLYGKAPDAILFSVLLLDLDYFKKINDQYGHGIGDQVLINLSRFIESCLRDSDVLARFGGEEFLIVLPRTRLDEAKRVAERVRDTVANADFSEIHPGLKITVSIGLCQSEKGRYQFSELLTQADEALYRAKSNGRNRIEVGSEFKESSLPEDEPLDG